MTKRKPDIYCSDPLRRNNYALVGYSDDMWNKEDERALQSFGCEAIFAETERMPAVDLSKKKALLAAMAALAPGGCLVVADLTRLAPSIASLSAIGVLLQAQSTHLVGLSDQIDSRRNESFFDILAGLARFEHNGKASAISRGLANSRARGKKHGRPRKFSREVELAIMKQIRAGATNAELAERYKVSRATITGMRKKTGDQEEIQA